MVHIPIDDQHLSPSRALRESSGHDHVVHQAKPHSSARKRMVARRAYCGKGVSPTSHRMINGRHDRSRGPQGGRPAVPVEHRIEEQHATSARAHRFQSAEIRVRMDREQRVPIGRAGLAQLQLWLVADPLEDRDQAGWSFRVIGTGIVRDARGMGENGDQPYFSPPPNCCRIRRASSLSQRRDSVISSSRRRYQRQ